MVRKLLPVLLAVWVVFTRAMPGGGDIWINVDTVQYVKKGEPDEYVDKPYVEIGVVGYEIRVKEELDDVMFKLGKRR